MDQTALTLIAAAHAVADTVLAPVAEHVDIHAAVPPTNFEALADAGLFGILGPVDAGGSDLSAHAARRVIAAIAGGCGATFFVWVQHHGVVRALRNSPNGALRDSLLAPLCVGEAIAGVAFAHARRLGPPAVRATRVGRGWQFDGFAPWTTSWGIAERFVIVGESADGELVWVMVDGGRADGVTAHPLDLPVLAGTGTVALHFDGFVASDDDVMTVMGATAWRATDRRTSSVGQTAALGVAERAVALLTDGAADDDPDAASAGESLRRQIEDCWRADDRLVAELSTPFDDQDQPALRAWIREASLHRAQCLELARTATTALLAASGGRGMDLTHPAQRLAREAMFYVIQAQTADGRSATLWRVSSTASPPSS